MISYFPKPAARWGWTIYSLRWTFFSYKFWLSIEIILKFSKQILFLYILECCLTNQCKFSSFYSKYLLIINCVLGVHILRKQLSPPLPHCTCLCNITLLSCSIVKVKIITKWMLLAPRYRGKENQIKLKIPKVELILI